MRAFSKDEVIFYAEKCDTNREVSFYNKSKDQSKPRYFRETIVFAICLFTCIITLRLPENTLTFVTWESSIIIELSLIAVSFTVYTFAFSFVREHYYGISVIDYALKFRPHTISSRINMIIVFSCFTITFLGAWFNCPKLFFMMLTIVATFVIYLLWALLDLFSGTGKLHNEIRTHTLEKKIGQSCLHPKETEHYISDLFEDAARNNLQNNTSLLEDDLYAIRCLYGVFSAELPNLSTQLAETLSVLHSNTKQLLKLLVRSGDCKHALILTRRCMSRALANQLTNDSADLSSISEQNVQQFDFHTNLQNIFIFLENTNIFQERLYDLMRDNLFVYAMTMESCKQHRIDAFPSDKLEILVRQAFLSISNNSEMTFKEKKKVLSRIFHLNEDTFHQIYQRRDGQNENAYFYDFSKWMSETDFVFPTANEH